MSHPNYAPPSYDASFHDPKNNPHGNIPPAGMDPEAAYLPADGASTGNLISGVGFEDNTVRRLFIRKVYSILTLQLIVTGAIIAAFQTSDDIQNYVRSEGNWLLYVSYGFFIFTYFCLVCPCCNFQRRYPLNIIFLCLLTLALSIMAAMIAMSFSTQTVLLAAGTTALVVAVVTLLTFWTKFDITQFWYIFLIMPFGMLFVWFFFFIPGINVSAVHATYCGLGVMAFTLYLAFDTKMIMGGGRFELSPDDYIEAVVQLYVDIVQIFLYLLQLFGRSD